MGKKTLIISILLIVLNIGLIIGLLYLLNYIGVVNAEAILSKLPGFKRRPVKITWTMLEEEELQKIRDSIEEKLKVLKKEEARLKVKEKKIEKREKELKLWEEKLAEEERLFEERIAQYEDQEAKLNKLAKYYQSMNPREAALILENLDDMTVINILRRMKDETVAITLMKMDPKRASEISRKMTD
jgi:flagellar motility protein MotE (MotC chaperone)